MYFRHGEQTLYPFRAGAQRYDIGANCSLVPPEMPVPADFAYLQRMIHHFKTIVAMAARGTRRAKHRDDLNYAEAKQLYQFRVFFRSMITDLLLLTIGAFAAGFGLKGFLLPNQFVDGGATGISLLINQVSKVPLSILLILVNLPFMIIGYFQLGKPFVLKTTFAIGLLAIVVAFVPYPVITTDKLLIAIFGGFLLGLGIGLAVRGGGVLDGTEVLAIFTSRKTPLTIGDVILLFNILIFSVAALLLGIEIAMYSVLTYLAAARTVDFVIEGIEEYTGVTIISPKYKEIAAMITQKIGRGMTVYHGLQGFGKSGHQSNETEIIFTVVTRLEVSRLQTEIHAIDPNAFVVMHSIKDTKGGMIKKRPLK
jgi:uncharacterized membrane-anchored protein YitT (DUF2179 family)